MFFAMDACEPADAAQQLISRIKHADPNLQWFALLDTAFDYEHAASLNLDTAISLFHALHLQILADVAPVLISLATADDAQLFAQLQALFQHSNARPMLSFVAIHGSVHELVKAWTHLHLVKTSDGESYLLRLADTRIQPALAQALSAAHWAAITAPLAVWISMDRFGQLYSLPATDAVPKVPANLSDQCLAGLLDLAQPDQIWDYLGREEPELLPSQNRGQTQQNWLRVCQYAQAQQFDFGQLIAVCRDVLQCGAGILSQAQLSEFAAPYQLTELDADAL